METQMLCIHLSVDCRVWLVVCLMGGGSDTQHQSHIHCVPLRAGQVPNLVPIQIQIYAQVMQEGWR